MFKTYIGPSHDRELENLGVEILNLGHNIHPPNQRYPDIDHPKEYYFNSEQGRYLKEYQLVYISNGGGVFEAHGIPPKRIGPGTVFLLFPGIWHRFYPDPKTGWEEYWVGFEGEYARYLLEQKCFSPENPVIEVGFMPEFLDTFSGLIKLMEHDNLKFRKMASFHVIHLLGLVYASVLRSNIKLSKKEEILRSIQNEIHLQWNKKLDFKILCQQFGTNYNWFRKSFKEVFSIPPSQYLLKLRLRNAARIIEETDLSISEIAYQCGFNSEHYFSRIFKKKMNMNPTDMRKRRKKPPNSSDLGMF